MAIRLLTDSAADFTPKELAEKKILCVPLTVSFGEDHYLDGQELSTDAFYEKLLSGEVYPKTSQPSPEAFLQHFQAAKDAGDTLIAITLSSAISGTNQSARLAQDMLEYPGIYVIDSRSGVTGLRLLLDKAAAMRDNGNSAEEIVDTIEALKLRVRILAMVDTLEYLHRGGRLTKTQAKLGGLANLKPIVSLNPEGNIYVADKSLGKAKAYTKILKTLEKQTFDPAYPFYFVYSHNAENCNKLVDLVKEAYPHVQLMAPANIGPTVGAHVGNNAFGITYVVAEA